MERLVFRLGLVVAMHAKQVGKIGVMITASHNQFEDNGIKIVEPDGSMLKPEWEKMTETIVNSLDIRSTIKTITGSSVKAWSLGVDVFSDDPIPKPAEKAMTMEELDAYVEPEPSYPHIYLGMDTR